MLGSINPGKRTINQRDCCKENSCRDHLQRSLATSCGHERKQMVAENEETREGRLAANHYCDSSEYEVRLPADFGCMY